MPESSPLAPPETVDRKRWLPFLGWLGGALLAAVLLFAAWGKALDPNAFAEQISGEGLALVLSAHLWAIVMIAVEVGLGVALLLNLRSRPVLLFATVLVLLFVFLTGRTYWRALHGIAPASASCGCFGNLVERTPAEAFWQDLALLLPPLALAWIGRPRPLRRAGAKWAATAALTAGGATFAALAPGLPLDDLATRLAPGTRLGEICAGSGDARICLSDAVPEIATGRHWVVLVDPDAPDYGTVVERLNAWALSRSEPPVTALADITAEKQTELFWRFAPAFDLHETPAALLRPLYRTLPRSFLVEEGTVQRTRRGVAADLVPPATPDS
ncbi:MAG: DoxX family protein [Thermoanaerobaculia bacterium]